jgi:hypothetical protein
MRIKRGNRKDFAQRYLTLILHKSKARGGYLSRTGEGTSPNSSLKFLALEVMMTALVFRV